MQFFTIPVLYFTWHYTTALRDIFHIWVNLVWFVRIFFSLTTLIRTLFSPWRRLHEERKRGLHLEDMAGAFFVNFLMRVVGAMVRIWFIILGALAIVFVCVGGILLYLVWIFLPIIVPALFLAGFLLLF